MTSALTAAPARPASSFRARELWVLAAASLWLITGLQLDAYAHSTTPDLETFWTPWHAVMYSGIAACGLTLLWLVRPRLPRKLTYRTLDEIPRALLLPLIGMALLLVGGGIDTLWHNLFGIEKDLEIFFSPSHFMLITGMSLVVCGPALMLAASPIQRLRGGPAALVLISALLTALPLHIYTEHASVLEKPMLGTGNAVMETFSLDAQMMHGYVGSTILLLLPVLIIARRWPLPLGMATILVMTPGLLIWLIAGDAADVWISITIAVAAAVVEVVARIAAPRLGRLSSDARWALLGTLAPVVVWGAVLAVGAALVGVAWSLHLVTGLLTLVALTGLATSLVVRRFRLAGEQAPVTV